MIANISAVLAAKPLSLLAAIVGFVAAMLLVWYPPQATQFGPDGAQVVTLLNAPQPVAHARARRYRRLSPWGPRLLVASFLLQIASLAIGE